MDSHVYDFLDSETGNEALIFKVNDLILAFPILSVIEIKPDNSLTRIPGYPQEVLGISLIRHELITILSSQKILKLPYSEGGIDIITKIDDGRKFGFRVSEILTTEFIPQNVIQSRNYNNYCSGFANIKNQLISLTTPQKLFKLMQSYYGE